MKDSQQWIDESIGSPGISYIFMGIPTSIRGNWEVNIDIHLLYPDIKPMSGSQNSLVHNMIDKKDRGQILCSTL